MTQEELARKSGITQQYLSQLERNDRKKSPTLRTIVLIAEALDIPPLHLLECMCNRIDCKWCEERKKNVDR